MARLDIPARELLAPLADPINEEFGNRTGRKCCDQPECYGEPVQSLTAHLATLFDVSPVVVTGPVSRSSVSYHNGSLSPAVFICCASESLAVALLTMTRQSSCVSQ